jgi:hypothetical protein
MGRALQGVAICLVLGVALGCAGDASEALPDWRDVTAASTVAASLGADKPMEGFAPSVVRDGSVAPPSAVVGLLNSGPATGSVTVGVSGAPAWLGVELHAVGAVEARGTTAEWWAVGKSHTAMAEADHSGGGAAGGREVGVQRWTAAP